jgi:protocatechuate 3,4-dioxygenase beta subunit
MTQRYKATISILLLVTLNCCNGQRNHVHERTPSAGEQELVGGGCDGCEIMFVDMPENINSSDTSAGWNEEGQKLLITGTVYEVDGSTPAQSVVIYYWQTDNNGYYSPIDHMSEKAKRHGHIRGWIKTDDKGKYSIYTIRPSPYTSRDMPAHIHTSIKEPDINNEYYIDEFVFDDDKLLTKEKRRAVENRGGSGILTVRTSGDLQIAEHDIVLGRNIPNYPDN